MKKIVKFMIFVLSFSIFTSSVFSANIEALMYKKISITSSEIEKIYGKKRGKSAVKAIDKFFIKIRGDKDKKKLNELENKLEPMLKRLESKKTLTRSERKLKIVAENLYYRSKILSEYIFK